MPRAKDSNNWIKDTTKYAKYFFPFHWFLRSSTIRTANLFRASSISSGVAVEKDARTKGEGSPSLGEKEAPGTSNTFCFTALSLIIFSVDATPGTLNQTNMPASGLDHSANPFRCFSANLTNVSRLSVYPFRTFRRCASNPCLPQRSRIDNNTI